MLQKVYVLSSPTDSFFNAVECSDVLGVFYCSSEGLTSAFELADLFSQEALVWTEAGSYRQWSVTSRLGERYLIEEWCVSHKNIN